MFRNQHLRAAAWDVNAIDPTYSAAAIGDLLFQFPGSLGLASAQRSATLHAFACGRRTKFHYGSRSIAVGLNQ
jgi:hypothetical protein